LSLILPNFSSNCEIIFHAFDVEHTLTKDLAEYLLMGIVSDTGSFGHINPTQSEVFLVAKILLETIGTSIDTLRARYGAIPKRIIPLLQELVKNTTYQSVSTWPDVQYSYIDRATLKEGNYSDEDMSAASHIYMGQYLPRIEGYNWGFVVTPRIDGSARMSSRALIDSINVRKLHEALGIGSGHDRAAGGAFKKETIDVEPKQCIVEVLEWMEHNTPLV
jgi:nanoRNase/pAp phosphatase (c-di-AMP/oligoRNAs hydrolase)